MAMELLTGHNQFVVNLPPDDEKDDLGLFHIIQDPEVAHPQLGLSERIRPQPLDGSRRGRRLVLEPYPDGGFQDALVADWQRPQLGFGVCRNGDPECHRRLSQRLRHRPDFVFCRKMRHRVASGPYYHKERQEPRVSDRKG
jgi:hypothetical protein